MERLFVAPGNAGTAEVASNVPIHFTDAHGLLAFARRERIDLTVIGQEAASEAGVVDEFSAAGLAVFGPTRAAARIESSKAFAKQLMRPRRPDGPVSQLRQLPVRHLSDRGAVVPGSDQGERARRGKRCRDRKH